MPAARREEACPTMFEPYLPRHFCREYVEIKRDSSQLVNFMAVVLGEKPLMDDWIHTSRLDEYTDMCRSLGLHTEVDSIFLMALRDQVPGHVVGRSGLTSTIAWAAPADSGAPGTAHVFVSRDPALLRHGMWYSLIVRDRVIWPPRMDVLRFGRLLGYPDCCIRFFQEYNNWKKFSFLWEIRRRSERLHPWCNPLPKDRTYAYIYHMPCSFACPATIERVRRLRSRMLEVEPELVAAIDHHVALPALVFRERKLYFFDGETGVNRIDYRSSCFEGVDPSENVCGAALGEGNAVRVEGARVQVLSDERLIHEVEARTTGFAPEIPFVIGFPPPW